MSMYKEEVITCPKCGHEQSFGTWQSINVSLDGHVKDELMKGSLYRLVCEECGCVAPVTYQCLYHDTQKRQMLCLIPSYSPRDVKNILDMMDDTFSQLDSYSESNRFGDYICRVVDSWDELREKILIFDSGRDDRLVELCKVMALDRMREQCPEFSPAYMYFYSDEKGEHFVVFNENGDNMGIDFPNEMYEHLLDVYSVMLDDIPKENCVVVNSEWASRMLLEKV